ncbi:MAG: FHA domain-containing protein [Planctomycetia bacterium]|nr:FHA domain-containing protein [Planctomycetia bacterium]
MFVVRGNDQGCRFELDADQVTIGRDVGNTIQLHDTEISRRHAVITREGRRYKLVDNRSSNGTFINGKRATTHVLAAGDELLLGSTLLLFTGGGDEPSELAKKIDVIARHRSDDRSRIVRTMPQSEGRDMFETPDASAVTSPWLAKARGNLDIMYRTTMAIRHTLDIDQLLHAVMQLIFEWVECDRGCVMLLDADSKRLEPRVRRNRKSSQDDERIVLSKTILDYVMEKNEGVLTSDASGDQRWNSAASILQAGIREAICAPMQGRHSLVGVIYIDTSMTPQQVIQGGTATKFNEEHLRLLVAIAYQAALAVEDTRYYSAMVQAERLAAVGQAIATLSHHVKNILQGIRSGSYLIKEGISNHDERMVSKGWEFVEKNQDRISHMVMDMLTFSKEREPEMQPADFNKVVGEVVELMEGRAKERNVQLHYEPAAFMPNLTFDAEGLHRAVLNVVSNAIDASDPRHRPDPVEDIHATHIESAEPAEPTPGIVVVRTAFEPGESLVWVSVEDNGGGIPLEEQEHIFSLFISTKGSRGTGLGLPVSMKIMKEHGGRITLVSQPGQGATFTLEMPAVLVDMTRNLDDPPLGEMTNH